MNLQTIDKMIDNAKTKKEINRVFMFECKKENNPDGFLYALSIIRYQRIIDRLNKSRQNYAS